MVLKEKRTSAWMKLIYAYIGNFRNIRNQEFHFSDGFQCSFRDGFLEIVRKESDSVRDAVFGDSVLRDLTLIVGETGAGKTNLLQLLGMDEFGRNKLRKNDSYLLLFAGGTNRFIAEVCNLYPKGFDKKTDVSERKYGSLALFEITLDNDGRINTPICLNRGFDLRTFIINCFDLAAFASPPCEDVHQEGIWPGEYFPRIVSPYGRTNIGIACEVLRRFVNRLPAINIKRKAFLRISASNWRDKLPIDLPEDLEKTQYWTYQDKKFQKTGLRNNKKSKQTPKAKFLHDLVADYAIYLRKWAEMVYVPEDEEILQAFELGIIKPGPRYVLPDMKGGGGTVGEILRRIEWLGSYIDCHSDELIGERGLVWQITDDIKDIYNLLCLFDDKYFTDETFSLPIVEMDFENPPLRDLFERMTAYRPDEFGVFDKELLPYEIVGVSSGEYQYAKTLGAIDEFCIKLKISNHNKEGSFQPNFILLLDEPEAYMHPEMCRRFLTEANEILKRRSAESKIQIIMTTHSPFMLSDVVSSQVIRMKQDESGYCKVLESNNTLTFAAGIHSIMARDFFLDFTIGEYSRQLLTDLLEQLRGIVGKSQFTEEDIALIHRARIITPVIGDNILRRYFESLLEE